MIDMHIHAVNPQLPSCGIFAQVRCPQLGQVRPLVIVTSALSASPILTKYDGAEFDRRFDLSAIQYRAVLRS